MRQIRKAIFETNSSSVHSLTMCSKSEYDAWINGELLLNEGWFDYPYDKQWLTREEAEAAVEEDRRKYALKEVGHEITDEILREHEIYTSQVWDDHFGDYYETFEAEHTASNGEAIIAFGYFGYDR